MDIHGSAMLVGGPFDGRMISLHPEAPGAWLQDEEGALHHYVRSKKGSSFLYFDEDIPTNQGFTLFGQSGKQRTSTGNTHAGARSVMQRQMVDDLLADLDSAGTRARVFFKEGDELDTPNERN